MDNEKLEWLHDHYKETYSLSKEAQKDRNKYFVFLCVSITCLLMFLIDTSAVEQTMAGWYMENISTAGVSFHINTIQSFVWVINLYLFIRYIQTNTYVERQYKYIENLEAEITKLSSIKFTRESKSYLESYPKVLDFIHIIYVWIYPLIPENVMPSINRFCTKK